VSVMVAFHPGSFSPELGLFFLEDLSRLRQLGEVGSNPPRLVAQQLGRRPPPRLTLIIDVAQRLSVLIADDKTGVQILEPSNPWWLQTADTKQLQPPRAGRSRQANDLRESSSQARLHAVPEAPSRKALLARPLLFVCVSWPAGAAFNQLHRPGRREATISHARAFRLIEVLSGRRETHSRYLWNTGCERRAGSECAVVSAIFVGRLATLHLCHFPTVPCRSPGREQILHSKLDIPARLASHSAALTRGYFSQSSSASPHVLEQRGPDDLNTT
jgi:hypothetical protein